MAVIVPVITSIGKDDTSFKAVIAALTTTNTSGTPIEVTDFDELTVQFLGTFGAGGTITLQGSNDKTNWSPLSDLLGNAITKTAAAMEVAVERCQWVRPFVSAGDGTTSLTTILLMRKARDIQV